MSRVDIYISHAVQAEAMSRMRFFNNNSELLYANAKVDDTKLQNRMDTLKQEIQEVECYLLLRLVIFIIYAMSF